MMLSTATASFLFVLAVVTTTTTSVANAWLSSSSSYSNSIRSSTRIISNIHNQRLVSLQLMMASKGSQKWEKKKAWLASRGLDEDGRPILTKKSTTTNSNNIGKSTSTVTMLDDNSKRPSQITIIGRGRIGSLLAQNGSSSSSTVVLGRDDTIDARGSGPIIICTRNDALDSIVDTCPTNRRNDLVFVQNGYLDDFLNRRGLVDNTQALLYLSVPSLGAPPVDGITAVNPDGLTTATGVHAQTLANLLKGLNLKCNVVTPEQYRPAMFEKLIWIATYMLVGTAKGCSSVGQAGKDYGTLVEEVVNELTSAVSAKEGIEFQDGTMERLAAYTDVVADFPCAVKEFEWRNQYFYKLGDDVCPTHNALLRECQEKGVLGFDLP